MATVGSAKNYVGADVVSDWYKRNLKIYANLSRIAEPNDRILLIIGQATNRSCSSLSGIHQIWN
jgi:hypothetical protein